MTEFKTKFSTAKDKKDTKMSSLNFVEEYIHKIKSYKALLVSSKSKTISKIIKNEDLIQDDLITLQNDYEENKKLIHIFGQKPRLRVAPNNKSMDAYELALDYNNGNIIFSLPAIDVILHDLQYIKVELKNSSLEELEIHFGDEEKQVSFLKKLFFAFKNLHKPRYKFIREAAMLSLGILFLVLTLIGGYFANM